MKEAWRTKSPEQILADLQGLVDQICKENPIEPEQFEISEGFVERVRAALVRMDRADRRRGRMQRKKRRGWA
jgi:hypothetical protein